MLLKLTTTHQPATDLGYLLAKNPARVQSAELSFGQAQICYPEASAERCSLLLLLEVDPVALVRRGGDGDGGLTQYVNDRPYVASSFLAVALAQLFSSALAGRSRERPELAATAIPLAVEIPVLRCGGDGQRLRDCFEPLGYTVEIQRLPLDPQFPEWGESPYFSLQLQTTARLSEVLSQLYVLLPAIDGDKHYYVGSDEVDKLVARGGDWLASHPQRDWILSAYLRRQRSLVGEALGKLLGTGETELEQASETEGSDEAALERRISLNDQRMAAIEEHLLRLQARSVLDVGCGEGRLLGRLLKQRSFERLLGIDVSSLALQRAAQRLRLEQLPARQRERIELAVGSLVYRDARMAGFDAACAIEVIEHIDAPRLAAFERSLFEFARPGAVLISTPNVEFNARFAGMRPGQLRHRDHRFEWTRAEFRDWATAVAQRHGYQVEFHPIGEVDPDLGPPTQLGIFVR
ncbi:MAG: 3' terminal RNA ribose 2'-O-methyltransferase Hen1 [Xanthomonadales bacterium]|nr:3' terminal RNA ribose 2'-O-methyltransferase Hen1 [Xanthomonadales bacterium]